MVYIFTLRKLFLKNQAGNETLAEFTQNGAVDLYYDNSKKFETTSGGATVTGTLTATAFSGDGSKVTDWTPSIRLMLLMIQHHNLVEIHGTDNAIHGRIKIFESGVIDLDTVLVVQ